MADKDVKIKIVTEYDGSGAAKAKADMAAMGKQSGKAARGSGSGSSVDPAIEAQKAAEAAAKAAAKEAEKAAKEVEKAAEKAAKAASKEAEKVAKEAEKQAREIEKQAAAAAKAAEHEAERAAKAVAQESAAAAKAAEKEAEKIAKAAVATSAEAIAGSKDIEAASTAAAKSAAAEALAAGKSVEDAASAATAASQAAIARIAKSAPAATASVGGLTKGFKFARMAAAAFATTAGKAFAWIGLINQCIELLKTLWKLVKTLWSWWNRDDEKKQEKRKQEMEKLAEATKAADTAMRNLSAKEADERYLARRNTLAKTHSETLDKQLKTLQDQNKEEMVALNLAALKLGNDREAEQLQLQLAYAAGELTEFEYKKQMQKLEFDREDDEAKLQRDTTAAEAKAEWDNFDALRRGAATSNVAANQREMGEGMYQSIDDYDVAKAKLAAGVKPHEREEMLEMLQATREHLKSLGYNTGSRDAVAQAFSANEKDIAGLRSEAETQQKEANEAQTQYNAKIKSLEALDSIDGERGRHQQTKRNYLLAEEDLTNRKEQEENKQLLAQQQTSKAQEKAAQASEAAADALADFSKSEKGDPDKRKNAASLLDEAKSDPEMMAKIYAASQGKNVKLSRQQEEKYGDQWSAMKGSSKGVINEVMGVARSYLVADKYSDAASTLQERDNAAATSKQDAELATKTGKTSESAQQIAAAKKAAAKEINPENTKLIILVEELTAKLAQATSQGDMYTEQFEKMQRDLDKYQRQLDKNNQQLQNLKRR